MRDVLMVLADWTRLWDRLPARAQGWLCNCQICRGETATTT